MHLWDLGLKTEEMPLTSMWHYRITSSGFRGRGRERGGGRGGVEGGVELRTEEVPLTCHFKWGKTV